MADKIISVHQNGGETATVHIENSKWGEVLLRIFPSGGIEVELPDGEDWAGPRFEWFRSSAYIGEAVETAIENKAIRDAYIPGATK